MSSSRLRSRSWPTQSSGERSTPESFIQVVLLPVIVQVTRQPSPSSAMLKAASLQAGRGFSKTRSIATSRGSSARTIVIDPEPIRRLPAQV